MSSDSSIFRYRKPEPENARSKNAKQDVATSSRRHDQFSDISHEIEPKEIPPLRGSAPRAEVNPSESQVKDEEGTNKSIFTRIFECFLCGSRSNLPEEVKRNLGQRFNIEDDIISLSERRIEPPSSAMPRSISSDVGQDDINNEGESQNVELRTSSGWERRSSGMEERHIFPKMLEQSEERYELSEIAPEKVDIKGESDEEKDARLFKELKKRIKALTTDEIKKKNQQFDERYHCEFEDIDKDKIRVKIKLIMQKEPLVTSSESMYENVIDFQKREIVGENNNNYQDLRHKPGKGRMNLSDLKYQSLRKAAEREGIAIPSSLGALVGGDIDEPGSKQEIREIFARNPTGRLDKGNSDFTKLLLTKIGKDKLWIVGQYLPHQEIDHAEIIKGDRSNYIAEVRFPLLNKESNLNERKATGKARAIE